MKLQINSKSFVATVLVREKKSLRKVRNFLGVDGLEATFVFVRESKFLQISTENWNNFFDIIYDNSIFQANLTVNKLLIESPCLHGISKHMAVFSQSRNSHHDKFLSSCEKYIFLSSLCISRV